MEEPTKSEKTFVTIIILLVLIGSLVAIFFLFNHFNKKKDVVEQIETIDLESNEGKNLVAEIENKYGDAIYFLSEDKIVDFDTLPKIEKICLGINKPDMKVTIDEKRYPAYSETQIISNLKSMFNQEIKVDPLEKIGKTLIYQEICPSDYLTYSSENAAYYIKPYELSKPYPYVLSKINRIERKKDNLVVYASAIFRDDKGIVYKDLKEKVKIAEFELEGNSKNFKELSKDEHDMEYYLQNSYQYIFTFTNDDNLYWLSYEKSEQ